MALVELGWESPGRSAASLRVENSRKTPQALKGYAEEKTRKELQMQITCYGHSCFAVEVAGNVLLFDPFITANTLAKSVDVKKVKADYLLISHGRFDHMADAGDIAWRTGAMVIANFEITEWLSQKGISKKRSESSKRRARNFISSRSEARCQFNSGVQPPITRMTRIKIFLIRAIRGLSSKGKNVQLAKHSKAR